MAGEAWHNAAMYLRANKRKKDGKEHRYWSVEESRRLRSGRVVQRRVLYLGEINDSQQAAWRKTLEVFDEAEQRAASLSLFPEDRALPADALDGVQVKLKEMELRRPRAFGNYWLGCELWRQLGLGEFWQERLGKGREEVPWAKVLELLVVSRLVAPGSEFRLHRQGFDQSALGDLLGTGFAVAEKDRLYRCLDRIGEHQTALFDHLRQRWQELFQARFDVLLYDLTSTYIEGEGAEIPKAKHGYLRKLRRSPPARDQLLLRIGAAKKEAGRAFGFVPLHLPREGEEVTHQTFTFHLDKEKLQKAERRDGHYLLRSNLLGEKPEVLWEMYILLAQIEAAFRTLKSELGLRPIYHQVEKRVEAHIFVAFLAYALAVTLRHRLAPCAPGLTPRAVLEKLSTIQMLDVCLPTTDGRWLIMPRYTQPEPEQMLLLHQLHLSLPSQPPPRIKPAETATNHPVQLKM